LNFESVSQFILTIEVTDGINKIQAFVTVLLHNLNDNAPVVSPEASVSLDENSTVGTTVYSVTASDADSNSLSYNIDSGNELGAFSIDSKTGIITVSNADVLDYEITQKFVLTVLVSDGSNIETIQIIINLSDLPDTAIITKPSLLTSTITTGATLILADGVSSTLITVQLKDASGMNFNTGGDTVIVSTTNGTLSNVIDLGNGTYQATLTSSTTVGVALLTATLNGAVMIDTEEVSFTEILIPVYTITITADELSIPADGSSSATITITIVDQNGQIATGLDVQAITTSGSLGNVTEHEDGTYSVVLTSSTTPTEASITVSVNGVAGSKTIQVRFNSVESEDFFIPEGFSPDGDGVNDVFVIRGAESLTISLKVYDRWGDLVFEKLPYKNDWDGSSNHGKLQDGTYYYVVHVINSLRQYVRYFTIKRK
jgi:gliding motility-associated-like protein